MRIPHLVIATTLAATAALGLAACTASEAPRPSSTSASTSTTAPSPSAGTTVYNDCIDDAAQIWNQDDQTSSKDTDHFSMGDCKGVNVISSDATITLGTVETLTIEGSNNTVTVENPATITVTGSGNTIHHTGPEPSITDEGQHNTVRTK
ncbi:DUF3060 domain-containing protein [Curtobacterium pusillum]|uniref:DUF3060 domain-containing protein n=1 Tax=Curtobacterium pusillum TaxID=69373 RepID=UPI0011A0879F|nr:DUF3060 domain-containing protein [Curtobacterium pusillum]